MHGIAASIPVPNALDKAMSNQLKKARRLAMRVGTATPCRGCRLANERCDKKRPCSRCIRMGEISCIKKEPSFKKAKFAYEDQTVGVQDIGGSRDSHDDETSVSSKSDDESSTLWHKKSSPKESLAKEEVLHLESSSTIRAPDSFPCSDFASQRQLCSKLVDPASFSPHLGGISQLGLLGGIGPNMQLSALAQLLQSAPTQQMGHPFQNLLVAAQQGPPVGQLLAPQLQLPPLQYYLASQQLALAGLTGPPRFGGTTWPIAVLVPSVNPLFGIQ